MLKPAQLYKDELQRKLVETWYDEKYKFYYDTSGKYESCIPDNCEYQRHFASVDKDGNILGYIAYTYDNNSSYAKWFGILCFEGSYCIEFIKDVIRTIDDIFYKFNLNSIQFQCFAMNPAISAYRRFIKKYGGREVATLRQTSKLMDGMFYDSVLFEILFEDLIYPSDEEVFDKFGDIREIYSKLHYDRLRIDRMMNMEESK